MLTQVLKTEQLVGRALLDDAAASYLSEVRQTIVPDLKSQHGAGSTTATSKSRPRAAPRSSTKKD